MRFIRFLITHGIALAVGFGLGVYLLPILTAPPSPDAEMLAEMSEGARYTATFTRDLEGSDFLHWGEGTVSVGPDQIVHEGRLSPGPDYKLYLVPEFVETEAAFEAVKSASVQLGDVKTFGGVVVKVPEGVDIDAYTTVLIWCEAFGEFITAAKYR
ncbi:DM13 domain-containing protein [Pseudaestuariivita sp.]|uniref:DM13 domain-containing protein n=1 Tax=Pseudaestuariivita sp. TaxID=2211669 RepID=UPI004059AD51